MFSIFKGNRETNGSKRSSKSKNNKNNGQFVSKRDGVTEQQAMEGADRELYQYEQPQQDLGMTDLIQNHEDGTRFMYAAITGKQHEDMESKLRRLIAFQPILKKKSIPVDNLPVIKLFRESETFPLDQIIPKSKAKSHGDYIRIADAITIYGAVVSPDCNFTKVTVGITDNRLLTDKSVKSFTATTNMMVRGNLALPYSVPTEDADQLILTISRERSFMEEGRQWGAIQIQLILEFSAFPTQFDNQPVAATNLVPSTALETPLNNPNNIDISILNSNRNELAGLYLSGDLADENEPIKNKTETVKYAKSSISGKPKGKAIEPAASDWSFMKDKRVGQINAGLNSIEPSINDISDHTMSVQEEVFEMRPATPPRKSSKNKKVSFEEEDRHDTPHRDLVSDINRLTPF